MNLFRNIADRIVTAWHERAVALKAVSFALVGVINAAVDYGVFFLALGALSKSAKVVALASTLTSVVPIA